jgi:pilus assembly protein Flp/PilA
LPLKGDIMQRAWMFLRRFVRADHGQDLVEYGVLAALIAVVAIAAITTLGTQIRVVLWQTIANNF